MKSEIAVNLVYEDVLSLAVLKKLLDCSSRRYSVGTTYNARGFGRICDKIKGFNHAAKGMPYLILTDLDNRYHCPPELIADWLGNVPVHPNLIFRIAVREVESWLLAARGSLASFLGIQETKIPQNTDSINDPKTFLLQLVKKSRKRYLKQDILPREGSTAKVGPDYNGRLVQYTQDVWNPNEAREHSESLSRTIRALDSFERKLAKSIR